MSININGDLLTVLLLHSLPNTYNNFYCAIKSRDTLPDIEKLMAKIIEEICAREHKADDESGAMFAKQRFPGAKVAPNSIAGDRRSSKDAATASQRKIVKCDFCGKKGHKSAKCFKMKREGQNANAADELFFASDSVGHSGDFSCSIMTDQKWCLDSGCTSNLCNNVQSFGTPREVNSCVKLASDATARVKAKGDIRVVTSDGTQNKSIVLQNALYVPNLRTNLLLVAKIVDKKHNVIFTERRA